MSVELTSVSKKTEEGLGKENAAFDNGEIDKRSQDVENNSKASFLKQSSLPVCLSLRIGLLQIHGKTSHLIYEIYCYIVSLLLTPFVQQTKIV